jgi:hypothetical protein
MRLWPDKPDRSLVITDTPGLNDADPWREKENMVSVMGMLRRLKCLHLLIFVVDWKSCVRLDYEMHQTFRYYAKLFDAAVKSQVFVLVFSKVPPEEYQVKVFTVRDLYLLTLAGFRRRSRRRQDGGRA